METVQGGGRGKLAVSTKINGKFGRYKVKERESHQRDSGAPNPMGCCLSAVI